MRQRSALVTFAAVSALGLGALVLAAAIGAPWTAFSLEVQSAVPVAAVAPGQTACQKPIDAVASFTALTTWVAVDSPPGARIEITVFDARNNRPLAFGQLRAGFGTEAERSTSLSAPVRSGQTIGVCLRNAGTSPVSLIGSTANPTSGNLKIDGKLPAGAASLVFLTKRGSLFARLATVFKRAALFHPGWVGPWTFWLLLAAMLGSFVVAGVAVSSAAGEDARGIDRQPDQ
jgi:hypothetical protein